MPDGAVERAAGLAYRLQGEGRADEALHHMQRAVRLAPRSAPLLSDLGIAFNQLSRRPEAFDAYARAISSDPTWTRAYNNLAVALQSHGDLDGARRAYRAALHLAPNGPSAVPLNLMRCALDGAHWSEWHLFRWLASRPPPRDRAAPWPWSRLEARAFFVESPALLHAAADDEAAAVSAAARH